MMFFLIAVAAYCLEATNETELGKPAMQSEGRRSYIESQVEKIVKGGNTRNRRDEASDMMMRLLDNSDDVTQSDIDLLVNLLNDSVDPVRYYVAMSLGIIGPRAKLAIPALEKALADAACERADKTSAPGIRLALTRIGSVPPTIDCAS